MALTTYWDSEFKVNSLTPYFKSKAGITSPQAGVAVNGEVEIDIVSTDKFLVLNSSVVNKAIISVSYDGTNYETETHNPQLPALTDYYFPVENLKKVKVKILTSVADLSFMLLSAGLRL